jgi:PIN domain nuclease of toxin-antitoxin system
VKLLLDTHLILWAAGSNASDQSMGGMSAEAAGLIDDLANELLFSAASIWEVAIKNGLGREDFKVDPHLLRRGLLDNGYIELAITSEHAAGVSTLANIHKDPFDRMLVAQAMIEGVTLLTSDAMVAAYEGPVRKV